MLVLFRKINKNVVEVELNTLWLDICIKMAKVEVMVVTEDVTELDEVQVAARETLTFHQVKPCSDLCQETRPKQILCQESLRRILKYKWGWFIPRRQNR